MSRVINPESAGKERNLLVRSVVLALRELMQQTEPNQATKDLAAYVAMALSQIDRTVELSVSAWEKRGYWLKADRFRLDWAWANRLGEAMRTAVIDEDWGTVAITAGQVAQRLKDVDVPKRSGVGTPWIGARKRLDG